MMQNRPFQTVMYYVIIKLLFWLLMCKYHIVFVNHVLYVKNVQSNHYVQLSNKCNILAV